MYNNDWFSELFGFHEGSDALERQANVQANLTFDDTTNTVYSHANGRTFTVGKLETPSVLELRNAANALNGYPLKGTCDVIKADVSELHRNTLNCGATFQAASQFNLLEMVAPYHTTPSDGITNYANDHTQGPVCAIECAAGTVYRNYYAQGDSNQIDCLKNVDEKLHDSKLWNMSNGYCMLTDWGVVYMDWNQRTLKDEDIFDNLQVGIQYDTEVVYSQSKHRVTQVYCSAIPVAYMKNARGSHGVRLFANQVLKKSYEATVYAAVLNAEITGNRDLFLTFVGGGAFGNNDDDIISVVMATVSLAKSYGINPIVVCYDNSRYNQMTELLN
jgi:hypothetical protein